MRTSWSTQPRGELRKRCLRRLCGSRVFGCGVRFLEALPDRRVNLLRVLTYHRVAEESERPDLDPVLISATPEQFARQMALLVRAFRPVSLGQTLEAIAGGRPLPPRAVLVTFDDGYYDFAAHAWPVLKRLDVPATLFVPTAFPDAEQGVFWWDRLHHALVRAPRRSTIQTRWGAFSLETESQRMNAFWRLRELVFSLSDESLLAAVDDICEQTEAPAPQPAVLGWSEIRRLADEGVAIVPHTYRHRLLDRLPLDEARLEIRRSREDLEQRLGSVPAAFAYPSGYYREAVVAMLREEGFVMAFTTVRGVNDLRVCDPLRLRRINIVRHSPDALLRFKLISAARWLNRGLPHTFPYRFGI